MNDPIQRIRPVKAVEPLSITRKVKRKEGDGQGNSLDWRDVLEDASQQQSQEKRQRDTPHREEEKKQAQISNVPSLKGDDFDEKALLERVTAHPEELLQSYKDPDHYTPLSEGKWVDSKG